MRKRYEILPIGSDVWAISEYYDKDGNASNYVCILPAKVLSFTVDYDKDNNCEEQSYWLSTPAGEEWGDSVKASRVAETFEELVAKMKKEWIKMANTH